MTKQNWRRGDRVRYVGSHCQRFNEQIGTVTGRDARGWLRVRFDFQESYEKGEMVADSSLERFDGTATEAAANAARIKIAAAADKADELLRTIAGIRDCNGGLTDNQHANLADAISAVREARAKIEAAQ